MPLMEWNDALSVKVQQMDQQHQSLIKLINELYDAMREARGKEVLSDVLKRLTAYTVTHFATEEKAMQKFGYEDFAAHKQQHELFIAKIGEFQQSYIAGKAAITGDLLNFLRDWLQTHIKGTDMKYGPFFNQHGMN